MKISLFTIFFTFLKIGAFTFGGGYVMIPLIQRELTTKNKWLESDDFYDILALVQGLPGPLALNCSIMVSRRLRGIPGSLTATAGLILPSVVVILAIASFFMPAIRDNQYAEAAFYGIRPAVTALVAATTWHMGRELLRDYFSIILLAILLLTGLLLQANPIWLLLLGGLAGWLYFSRKGPEEDECLTDSFSPTDQEEEQNPAE